MLHYSNCWWYEKRHNIGDALMSARSCLFIGPRCPWGPIYGSGCLSLTHSLTELPCADLTDVTLADEDTNSILTDNANRAIQGNVAMQVAPSGGQICN